MSRARLLVWGAAVLLLALGLRVRHAQQRDALWGDEAQDMALVNASDSLADLFSKLRAEGHPPLHYVVEYLVQEQWGAGPDRLRWLAIVFGVATIALLMAIVHRRLGPHCALLTGFFVATAPYFVHYATEIRAYALFGLLSVVFMAALLRFLERPGAMSAVLWGASVAALAYTHYYALCLVAGGGLFALLRDLSRRNLYRIVLAGMTTLVLLIPWLPTLQAHLTNDVAPWYLPSRKLSGGLWLFYLPFGKWGALLIAWGFFYAFRRIRRPDADAREAAAFRAFFWTSVGSGVAAWTFSLLRTPFLPRYLIGTSLLMLPGVCLYWARLLAGQREQQPERWRRIAIGLVLVALLLQRTSSHYWVRRKVSASAAVAQRISVHEKEGDLILFLPPFMAVSVNAHYDGALPQRAPPYRGRVRYLDWVDLKKRLQDADLVLAFTRELEEHLARGGRVWYVTQGEFPVDREWAFETKRPEGALSELKQYELHFARQLLRTLYRGAEDVYVWDGPRRDFREPMTLILFRPKR